MNPRTTREPYVCTSPDALDNDVDAFKAWVTGSAGLAKGVLTTDERMNETRGEGMGGTCVGGFDHRNNEG
jgi:hypothetical protein